MKVTYTGNVDFSTWSFEGELYQSGSFLGLEKCKTPDDIFRVVCRQITETMVKESLPNDAYVRLDDGMVSLTMVTSNDEEKDVRYSFSLVDLIREEVAALHMDEDREHPGRAAEQLRVVLAECLGVIKEALK